MTNEDAIICLKGIKKYGKDTFTEQRDWQDSLDIAINALHNSDEDCISRTELLKAVDTWDKFGCDADTKLVPIKDCYVPYIRYDDVVKAIKGMPSIQPKAKVGRWVKVTEGNSWWYKCSECDCRNWGMGFDFNKYCPGCGARMEEVEE